MNHHPLGLKSVVYHGDFRLGEVEIFSTTTDQNNLISFPNNEIRINYLSQQSERCLPLSILQTISLNTVRFKLNSTSPASIASQSDLATLYYSCLRELKTAVIVRGEEELHLVPMMSKQEKDKLPCFWGCSVPVGIYGYCLGLLNLRCLSIVFDLDETLIVANTMRSFEDRIEFLQKRLECEDDPLRVSGMSAELRRYVEDRSLLKQYIETDSVVDNGKLVKVQFEEVTAQPVDKERVVRPIIRLKERNIVLTRINPEVRDTSVLVRLRPAWEDLRSYLNAKGRKRFEVYVCTMAERDYALEMWRLLDPEAHLIHSDQLPSRVVCVKSGAKKSLSSVFHDGTCHPKMAMVIDDRLKVWEDTDQPRVHVVPAFTPYYAPQAETANAVPVLCVARNVACNVRAGFFKEFDENLLRRIYELSYEDDIATLPSSPDVSDFLLPEDTVFVPNGNRDIPFPEGMRDAEVEERLNKVDVLHPVDFVPPLVSKVPDIRPEASQQPASPPSNDVSLELSKVNVPLQKSGLLEASSRIEVNPPELDPDKRRRLFGMHYVRDTRAQNSSDHSFLKPPVNASPAIQSSRGWLLGEDSTSDQINNQSASVPQEYDASQDKPRVHQNLHFSRAESGLPGASSRVPEVKIEETLSRQEGKKLNHSLSSQSLHSGDTTTNQATKEFGSDAEKVGVLPSYLYIGVLQEIGRKCGSKIEYRSVVNTSKDLQFSVEVLFTGEKIAAGSGKTKKDAQQQAAENALRTLADEYRAYESGSMNRDLEQLSLGNDNGFLWDDPGPDDASPSAHSSGPGGGAVTNSFETHEARKRPSSPRPGESFQNKRLKGEFTSGLQVGSSQYKNGNTVS